MSVDEYVYQASTDTTRDTTPAADTTQVIIGRSPCPSEDLETPTPKKRKSLKTGLKNKLRKVKGFLGEVIVVK